MPIVAAEETGTVMLKPAKGPVLRALRTERTTRLEREPDSAMVELGDSVRRVYFEGDLEAGVALSGQVAGRIEAIVPVAEVIERTVRKFHQSVEALAKNHLHSQARPS